MSGVAVMPVGHAKPHAQVSPEMWVGGPFWTDPESFWKAGMHGVILNTAGLW